MVISMLSFLLYVCCCCYLFVGMRGWKVVEVASYFICEWLYPLLLYYCSDLLSVGTSI